MDISIIITAHQEGLLLNKTLLSVKEATDLLPKNTTYETILNLDNPDKETLRVANLWVKQKDIIMTQVSFGNPADNRNDAIKKAQGKFVTLLDGDDLVSANWLKAAYDLAKKQKGDFIIRPEIHMQFGYEEKFNTIWRMQSSRTKQEDAVQMAYWNLWSSVALFTTKDFLRVNPYRVPHNGFGFEDYLFNADSRALNIPNIIAPGTVLFYRRRNFSVTTLHEGTILGYSSLFDINSMKSIPLKYSAESKASPKQKIKTGLKRGYRFAFDTSKKIAPLNRAIGPIARDILYKKKSEKIPSWLIDEWKNINKIENQLWPTKGEIAKLEFHPLTLNPYDDSLGQIYHTICHSISDDHLDYLFLAPSMSGRGGTEKLIANYIKAIKKVHPEWKIGILSTQPFTDLALEYFNSLHVDMLDFGKLTSHLGVYEKDIIWSRLLIQSKVKRLHLVNDEYWYKWIYNHQELLIKNNYKLYISLFMREFTHDKDQIKSFADPDLMEIWPAVTKVFTDNQRVIDDALENNAFDQKQMITHYQPQDFDQISQPKLIDSSKPLRILWASRIAFQKRPDLLKQISKKLDDNFEIDAYGLIEQQQYSSSYFSDSKISYKGNFNGISSIDTSKYDIYLYTSQTDGVPNILMEVAAAGLPIIASDAGGVKEVIKNNETGFLVNIEDIDGYVNALHQAKDNPDQAQSLAIKLQQLVQKQHSWDKFIANVKKDIQ